MWPRANRRGKPLTRQGTITTRTTRISGFLALQRSTAGVLAMVVLIGMGERMAERFLPIYMMAMGGGAFLWQISPQTNLITAFVFGIIGTLGFAVFGRGTIGVSR